MLVELKYAKKKEKAPFPTTLFNHARMTMIECHDGCRKDKCQLGLNSGKQKSHISEFFLGHQSIPRGGFFPEYTCTFFYFAQHVHASSKIERAKKKKKK